MNKIIVASLALVVLAAANPQPAAALSCLPIDMYLKEIVGDEETVIFTATAVDRLEETDYTAEVLEVNEAMQGYVESTIMVYHQKHPDWGYLCNSGPKAEGSEGVYVAGRNEQGQYNIYQRLDLTDPLVAELEDNLEEAEVEGGVGEITETDRMNQIMTTIQDLLKQIQVLVKEYLYWRSN